MDDAELWKRFVRNITPLHSDSPPNELSHLIPPQETSYSPIEKKPPQVTEHKASSLNHEKKSNHFYKAPEKHQKKRMLRGTFHYLARLDLHGLSLNDAYYKTAEFIQSHYQSGIRHILLITGKGSRQKDGSIGILRPQMIEWFHSSSFAEYISIYHHASPKDGGKGAFYVILKNKI